MVVTVDLDILDGRYLIKTGDTMEAPLNFQRGTKDSVQFKISPNSGDDFATNIYSFYGQMRFRTTHTNMMKEITCWLTHCFRVLMVGHLKLKSTTL